MYQNIIIINKGCKHFSVMEGFYTYGSAMWNYVGHVIHAGEKPKLFAWDRQWIKSKSQGSQMSTYHGTHVNILETARKKVANLKAWTE